VNKTPIELLSSTQLTPVDLDALRKFWDGLYAVKVTLIYGAPGRVAIAISKEFYDLLESYYGRELGFQDVMANVWVQDAKTIKHGGDVRTI
jgi:hypothetical protein